MPPDFRSVKGIQRLSLKGILLWNLLVTARPFLRLLALMFSARVSTFRKTETGGMIMKSDIYTQVADRIIDHLQAGVILWKSPNFSKVGFPRNFATGRAYQGINVFLLGSLRCTSPFFLTFIQAKELGGHVHKGEKGSLGVKYGTYNKQEEGSHAEDGEGRGTPLFEGLHRVSNLAD